MKGGEDVLWVEGGNRPTGDDKRRTGLCAPIGRGKGGGLGL